jgi:plasmid stabilization system protein ParE
MVNMEDEYFVVWAPTAFNQFRLFIRYIREDSPKNAIKIQNSLLNIIYSLRSNPERFSIDNYKKNNKGHYRYFEKCRISVSFMINNNTVKIVRCVHTRKEPRMY